MHSSCVIGHFSFLLVRQRIGQLSMIVILGLVIEDLGAWRVLSVTTNANRRRWPRIRFPHAEDDRSERPKRGTGGVFIMKMSRPEPVIQAGQQAKSFHSSSQPVRRW